MLDTCDGLCAHGSSCVVLRTRCQRRLRGLKKSSAILWQCGWSGTNKTLPKEETSLTPSPPKKTKKQKEPHSTKKEPPSLLPPPTKCNLGRLTVNLLWPGAGQGQEEWEGREGPEGGGPKISSSHVCSFFSPECVAAKLCIGSLHVAGVSQNDLEKPKRATWVWPRRPPPSPPPREKK